MTEQLAMRWYSANKRQNAKVLDARVPKELREREPEWMDLTETRRNEIRRRVRDVMNGEIPRSKLGPEDLEIHFGRYRALERNPPEGWPGEPSRCEGPGYNIIRQAWWDCIEVRRDRGATRIPVSSTRLFGNANVGNLIATNLQVAGQFCYPVHLHGWHARTAEREDDLPFLERIFGRMIATMNVGDRPVTHRSVAELWQEPAAIDVTVPDRQNFNVTIEFFDRTNDELTNFIADSRRDGDREPFRLWIQVEGWAARDIWW